MKLKQNSPRHLVVLGLVVAGVLLGCAQSVTAQWSPNANPTPTPGTNIYYNSGNVGIGTTSPVQKLDVNGSIQTSGDLQIFGSNVLKWLSNDAGAVRIYTFSDTYGIGTSNTNGDLSLFSGGGGGITFTHGGVNATPQMRIDILGVTTLADQLAPARVDPFNQSGNQIQARDAEWSLPLVSLPGRAGLDLGISLTYSSMVWTQAGSYISFDDEWGDPSPGFKIGFPAIQGRFTNNLIGTNVYVLITSAGRRAELRRVGTSNIYEAGDSSYLQLIDYGGSLLLRTTDGTQMTYNKFGSDWHCTAIEDRNGNLILTNYNSFGDILDVTDALGRLFTFNYDGNYNLISITQTWTVNGVSQTHTWATFGWGTVTMHPAFSGVDVVGVFDGEVIPVLTQVGLPDGSHYNFEYNSSGQATAIRRYTDDNPTGTTQGDLERTYTTYNYDTPAADCPRITAARLWADNWSGVAGVPLEVVTYFADNHDGSHQMTTPDATVYKEFYGGSGDLPAWQHGLITSTQVLSGGTAQKTTTIAYTQDNTSVNYQTNPRVTETSVYDSVGNRRRVTFDYSVPWYTQFGLPYAVREYAADATTVLRETVKNYQLDQPYLDRRIIGLVSQVHLIANGYQAKMTYGYDDPARLSAQAVTAPLHDQSYDGYFTVRGNVTSVSRWDVTDINNSTKALTTFMNYNAAGSLLSTIDPSNHTSSIAYADSFSDGNNARGTFAYPTTMTDGDGYQSFVQYNYDFSAKTRVQGPPPGNPGQYSNGIVQTFSYDEALR
ncbi:MAG TPA: hypothetical protein VHQ95_22320, partial [Pyrinomonadaceae bacterium]|nr:hypothetical protein [Pyrinomonadaceae bacterium]